MVNAKRRISAKRTHQFRGNRSTNKNCSSTSTNGSSSKIKMIAAFDVEMTEYEDKPLTGNIIMDTEVLNCSPLLCCPRCFQECLLLSEDSKYGSEKC
ncbi:hypothetical protein TNCV_2691811 [Trichonephila clavipes]|uniref:Uncharacterized protein n=1 Tax=Trichonephila clavipes TaxID=2585209 RepID=A0A8X7BAD5_TRICX|nr:hypothetical protein TNCV_2691811 [Trichonephila clavipes]